MYRFIKNTFFVSLSLGFLFGVAFLSSLFIFATNSFAQQPLYAAVDNSLFGSYTPSAATSTPSAADATVKTTSTITNNTPTTASAADYAGNGNNDNQNQSILNKTVRLNHYENNELGVSLKYPSNFLIDESNSNNTLRQISFYPLASATATTTAGSSTTGTTTSTTPSPEQYILWMDVFIQKQATQQHPLLSLSNRLSSSLSSSPPNGSGNNNNNDLASYSLNLANSIQQANKDVSIIGSSSNVTLSGYPAYKLITKSFIGNTAIVDVLVSTSVNNTVYSLDFQSNSSSYPNSISDTNKIIQSFKIFSPLSLASNNGVSSSLSQPPVSTSPSPSTSSQQQQQQSQSGTLNTKSSNSLSIPSLSSLLSDLQLNNVANNSTHILKSLKNSITNSVKDVLSNPQNAIDNSIKGTTSLIPTSPSDLSSLSSGALKKACGLPFVSDVCSQIGNSVSNKDQNPNSTNKIVNNTNNGGNKTSSSNSIFNNEIINKDNGVAGNGTGVNATAAGRSVGIGNGEDSIKSGSGSSVVGNVKLNNNSSPSSSSNNNSNNSSSGISVNNKRNSLMAILDHLLNTNTNNSSNQSLSSNSSMLGGNGGGLSFLKKLLTMYFSFSSQTNNPHNISTAITPYSLNSSILSATTEGANQSNSTVMPSSTNSSSSHSLSSLLAPSSPSSYIPPPIH